MAGDDTSKHSNRASTLSVETSALSPHFPQDPDTSTRHIRFSTPPSSLCASSPELSLPPSVSRRVQTRPETPSALTILAAVCSSPSVRWDGVKHQYAEGHGKSIWCEDMRMPHESSRRAHIVDPSSPNSPRVYGERPFTFRDTIKENMEGYEVPDTQNIQVAEDMHYPTVEDEDDEDIPAPKIPADQDYFSEFPSSPPTLVFSSPYSRTTYDFSSSSERSFTLPLSSPGLLGLHKATVITPVESAHDADMDGVDDRIALKLHDLPSDESDEIKQGQQDLIGPGIIPSTSEEGHGPVDSAIQQVEAKPHDSETFVTDCEPTCTPSLSPLRAPERLPPTCLDLSFSPLSSLRSSPLSEIMDEVPSSPAASRFSVMSDVVFSRSTSPDSDMNTNARKSKVTGRRASANVIGIKARRMSGISSTGHWQRPDTAPPETTPSKRPRQSSPSSPVLRPLQVRRLSSSSSLSLHSNGPIASSAALEENQRVRKKAKYKSRKTTSSTSTSKAGPSKSGQLIEPPHPSNPPTSHRRLKRNNAKLSKQRLVDRVDTDATTSESRGQSSAELTALPMTGFLVETLALSRASAMAAPELLRAVLKSQPHLMEERTEKLWLELVRHILEKVRIFGRIERKGTDAADRPLEDQWFYIPENDEDGRAELLKGLMPKKRDVTKRSKQYYFEPVQKVSRWDPEDD